MLWKGRKVARYTLLLGIVMLHVFVLPLPVHASEGSSGVTGSVTIVDDISPAKVTDLAVTSPTQTTLTLTWTAPGDDGNAGTATQYDIRYSSSIIDTQDKWQAATQVSNPPTPQSAGLTETFVVTGLSPGTTYYFALKTADEVPNWSDLSNSPWGVTLPPPPPPPAVGGGPPPVYYIRTNLFGIEARYRISSQGKILEIIEAISEDGMLPISIPRGTIALDKDGRRLKSLWVLVDETPPPPPEGVHIIGLAYDFAPKGATFTPPITLTWSYDPAEIPGGVAEEDLILAYYDEDAGEWVECECTCDPETHCITARVCHFTCFTIVGFVTPPPLPPPAPAAFISTSLSISPPEVSIGQTVSISVLVTNTGEVAGSYTVTLKINGVVEATKEVTVHAGFSKEATFTISKDVTGTYSVDIDGLTGSFTVKEKPVPVPPVVPVVPPPPRVNWAILGPIIGVAVFLAIFLPIRLRKRRRAA